MLLSQHHPLYEPMHALTQRTALALAFTSLAMLKLSSASAFLQPSSASHIFNPDRGSCPKRTLIPVAMSANNEENLLESMSKACSDTLGREVKLETSRGGGASGGGTKHEFYSLF